MIRRVGVALLTGLLMLWVPLAQSRPVSDPDNPHNLSIGATHGRTQATDNTQFGANEICIFCHTPHSATALGPLWNRAAPDMMGSFPLYNSASLQIKNIAAAQYNTTDYPNGASKLCLSCHDGVTGIGTLLDRTITMNHETMSDVDTTATFDPVIDLAQTHPVSFVLNQTVLDAMTGGKVHLPTLDLRDSQDRVQCTTCHNPHDDSAEAVYNTAGVPPFWRHIAADPADSYDELCLECHGIFRSPSDHHTDDF